MDTKDILYNLRAKKGLSQDELAEKVFVTRQAVSRWENGETTPNVETLKLLSKFYDVSINTLLGSPRQLICQCCGMPLEDSTLSRETDGSFNEEYCKWCYADGEFTYSSKEQLIDFCAKHMASEKLAGAAGSRPYGSAGSYIESLEIIAERKVSARHRQAETFCMPFESNRFTVFLRRGSRSSRRPGCRRRPAGSARWPAPTGLVHLR